MGARVAPKGDKTYKSAEAGGSEVCGMSSERDDSIYERLLCIGQKLMYIRAHMAEEAAERSGVNA